MWAPSLKETDNGLDTVRSRRHTWHMVNPFRQNEGRCNRRYHVGSDHREVPPEGARICAHCEGVLRRTSKR